MDWKGVIELDRFIKHEIRIGLLESVKSDELLITKYIILMLRYVLYFMIFVYFFKIFKLFTINYYFLFESEWS